MRRERRERKPRMTRSRNSRITEGDMPNNLKNRFVECADVSALWATRHVASGRGSAGVSPAPAGVSPGGIPEVSGETPATATETVALVRL